MPYIIPQFDHYVETPFSPTEDNFFNCDVDRPSPDTPVDDRMIFANHNLNKNIAGVLVPDKDNAASTNSVGNIRQQTEICVADHGRNPNVVMVSFRSVSVGKMANQRLQLDFVSEGEVIQAQRELNGL